MDNGANDKLARSPGENGGRQDAQNDVHPGTERDKTTGKTQERMEGGSGKRSSSAGSKKMERDGDGQKKMEGHCSTGQSPQRAVVPMEEEEVYLSFASALVHALSMEMLHSKQSENLLKCW
jgi:hypothetical protein